MGTGPFFILLLPTLPTLPTAADARADPYLRALSSRWDALSSLQRRARSREERRALQTAQRNERSRVEALCAFAKAGPGQQRILLVRHGEAAHNSRWREHSATRDTLLTERGHQQAQALAGHSALAQCTLVVVSPLSRAIQTAVEIFGEQPRCRVCLCALHTERHSDTPCNTGTPRSELAMRFPFVRSWEGFHSLPEQWWPTAEDDAHDRWRERVLRFLAWLRAQPESRVVVIGHGAFCSDPRLAGRMLANCEVVLMNR